MFRYFSKDQNVTRLLGW
ncbi:hypothetical protein PFAG_02591 [Plasmodium falciparum Santa Lucia]|uniref:Uncharacterized protein n=7 Tax=Plasmodium falciparum TaxID=5833 RepID=W7JUI1_PLAFO|nr:hypothetical protein PFFVO_02639 [Plasmodium falciparum Vietnam Oak-Knoll (FVO)]ETW30838.1 hypothetical protein PFFCH_01718 [Plasmodium falciparum FCH/4]ETW42869.1 hypothetical protein PFNF135_02763 [Plasmodium falciparum NF135/5.C10]ETW61501.1 hypothetical protein PFMC_02592 [Plasmodium falciparum CAMP/Malaysia]EUR72179.1 hypothetical protein PFBG_02681 [Plasmodium falciparum 7G8]EUT86132.1 hypothetical protein PFAG_02591 [Plasmodium falciparum Santa Lucia]EWC88608.1 hypothetical protein 